MFRKTKSLSDAENPILLLLLSFVRCLGENFLRMPCLYQLTINASFLLPFLLLLLPFRRKTTTKRPASALVEPLFSSAVAAALKITLEEEEEEEDREEGEEGGIRNEMDEERNTRSIDPKEKEKRRLTERQRNKEGVRERRRRKKRRRLRRCRQRRCHPTLQRERGRDRQTDRTNEGIEFYSSPSLMVAFLLGCRQRRRRRRWNRRKSLCHSRSEGRKEGRKEEREEKREGGRRGTMRFGGEGETRRKRPRRDPPSLFVGRGSKDCRLHRMTGRKKPPTPFSNVLSLAGRRKE